MPADHDNEQRSELRALAHRLLELAEDREPASETPGTGRRRPPPASEYSPRYLRLLAMTVYRIRRRRARYFDPSLFGEVAWDMLLDLFIQAMDGKHVTVTSLCLAAEAPMATGIRWIGILEEKGLVQRTPSDNDARVIYIGLTDQGLETMKAFLGKEYAEQEGGKPFMLSR